MDIFFSQALTDICEHSLVSPGRPLRCTIIANPAAGGFVIKSRWQKNSRVLNEYQQKAQAMPKREIYKSIALNLTEGKGSANETTRSLINRAEKDRVPFNLIISAGGDGTHGEIMLALYNAPDNIRENMAVLRIPMGTGNDGADNAHMEKALDLLINPVHVEYAPAVQLKTSANGSLNKKGPFIAFNILSAGLDAYVTHMTNLMKEKTPGDSYKLWLDIATLFYERKYKVDFINVKAFDENDKEVSSFKEKLLILVMGASGHRTYGSQHRILPDDRNVCAVKQMPLFQKLAVKSQITKGAHANNPRAIILSASRVEFTGLHPILAQMDGETVLLKPDDFPASLELTKPVIPLLKMDK
ncbi:MAG: diacylglycerol kinase [Treponema sp.]|jgi:diacylglycerol kinase family enzyme|nr:diacylglycerol kinase [Treponema sp.]